jgi:hypothetical protein
MHLLRSCALPRLNYLSRVLPPAITRDTLVKFDHEVISTVYRKLNMRPTSLTAAQLKHLRLPIRMGGLGIRALAEISSMAYFACTAAAAPFIKQTLKPLLAARGIAEPAIAATLTASPQQQHVDNAFKHMVEHNNAKALQSGGTFPKDALDFWRMFSGDTLPHLQRLYTANHESAVMRKLAQDDKTLAIRVMSCTSRHASRWLTTFPRTPHHQLPNADFEVAVRLRLGAPLFDHAPLSCICKSDVSEQKSPGHMLVCRELRGVPLMQRHNIVVARSSTLPCWPAWRRALK